MALDNWAPARTGRSARIGQARDIRLRTVFPGTTWGFRLVPYFPVYKLEVLFVEPKQSPPYRSHPASATSRFAGYVFGQSVRCSKVSRFVRKVLSFVRMPVSPFGAILRSSSLSCHHLPLCSALLHFARLVQATPTHHHSPSNLVQVTTKLSYAVRNFTRPQTFLKSTAGTNPISPISTELVGCHGTRLMHTWTAWGTTTTKTKNETE